MSAQPQEHDDYGKRRMPDNLRKYLLKVQGGKMYLPAAYRVVWFRDELGDDWGIETLLLEGGCEAGFATVQAKVYGPDGRLRSSGIKTETRQDFPAGWVEKAETGALSRALSVLGFGTQFDASLDDDGSRPADSPQPMRGQPRPNQPSTWSNVETESVPTGTNANGNGEDDREKRRKAGSREFHTLCTNKNVSTADRNLLHHIARQFLNPESDYPTSLTQLTAEEWEHVNDKFRSLPHAHLNGIIADYNKSVASGTAQAAGR